MRWEYFSKRRGLTLETYLVGVETLGDALEFFRKRNIDPPVDGQLEKFYERPAKSPEVTLPLSSAHTAPAATTDETNEPVQRSADKKVSAREPDRRSPRKTNAKKSTSS